MLGRRHALPQYREKLATPRQELAARTPITIISRQLGTDNDSITRIAAGVVTGVGFLGAGAIIQDRGGVHGLTTAATIWLVASIGMACGAGFKAVAALSTLVALIVLIGLGQLEKPLQRYGKKHTQKNSEEQTTEK